MRIAWFLLTAAMACRPAPLSYAEAERRVLQAARRGPPTDDSAQVEQATCAAGPCSADLSCWSDSLPAGFADAMANHRARNLARDHLDASTLTSLGHPAADTATPRSGSCRRPPVIAFSQVGLDSVRQVAIVTVYSRTGPGPFPGCGFSNGETLLLRRIWRGRWRVIAHVDGWMS